MALAKWRETSQNLFCPICMHHLLLFSLPLSTLNALLDWDRIFASWLLLGLVKRGNCLQRKCTKTKIKPFHHLFCGLYCNEDHLHLMIYCSPFNGCVDIINFFVRSKGLKKLEKNSMELWENNMRWWNSATQIYWDGRKGKSVSRPTAHGRERLVCKDFPTQTLQHHHSGATAQQHHLTPILTPTQHH